MESNGASLISTEDSKTCYSRQEVDGVGELEGPFRVAASEVALLIAHRQKNGVALLGELAPLRSLEIDGALEQRALGLQDDPGPLVSLFLEIALGRVAEILRATGDEEHRDAELPRASRERQRRLNGLRLPERLPCPETARTLLEIARAVHDPGPPIYLIGGPIG